MRQAFALFEIMSESEAIGWLVGLYGISSEARLLDGGWRMPLVGSSAQQRFILTRVRDAFAMHAMFVHNWYFHLHVLDASSCSGR